MNWGDQSPFQRNQLLKSQIFIQVFVAILFSDVLRFEFWGLIDALCKVGQLFGLRLFNLIVLSKQTFLSQHCFFSWVNFIIIMGIWLNLFCLKKFILKQICFMLLIKVQNSWYNFYSFLETKLIFMVIVLEKLVLNSNSL